MALFPTGGESDKRPESVNSPSQVPSFVFLELTELIQRPWSLAAILSRFHGQKTDSRTRPEQVQDPGLRLPQVYATSGQSFLWAVSLTF